MGGWLIDIQGEVLHSCEKGTLSVSPGDLDVRQNCHAADGGVLHCGGR